MIGSCLYISGQCIDDNECNGDNECGDNSECHNLSPGYECNCKEGYKPSGEACVSKSALSFSLAYKQILLEVIHL